MTTIVMVEHDGDVLIGHDSRLSGGNYMVESPNPKVITNNGIIYGVSGCQAAFNLIAHTTLPGPPPAGDTDRWVTVHLVRALRAVVDKVAPRRGDDPFDIGILAVVNGSVYEFSGVLGWNQATTGEYAIGSGASYAIGALSAGASVEDALTIAATHDPGTGGTIHLTTANALLAQAGYVPAVAA